MHSANEREQNKKTTIVVCVGIYDYLVKMSRGADPLEILQIKTVNF